MCEGRERACSLPGASSCFFSPLRSTSTHILCFSLSLSLPFTVIAALALAFSLGLALQGAACYANYWPLLTALAYLLFPMPSLFFSETAPGVAKWLTGFSTTAAAGIVATLWHAGWVPGKAAALQVAAVGVLCGTWGAYDRLAGGGEGYW